MGYATPEAVPIRDLIQNPVKFHGAGIRVTAPCRIEFEGTAVYVDAAARTDRESRRAVWVALGWPVDERIRALDGHEITVEGTVDAYGKGHFGMFAASLTRAQFISAER